MISAWHLLWIVPLSGAIGFLTMAFFTILKDIEEERNHEKQNLGNC